MERPREDRGTRPPPERGPTAERRETFWLLAAAPTLWAAHFLACYVTAAVWCARAPGGDGGLGWVPLAVGGYTALALAGIGVVMRIGWRRHEHGAATVPHDFDTRADRHRFLGFATVLLAGLSGVSVLYVAIVALFFRTCR